MSHLIRLRRSSRRLLLAATAFLLVMGMLSAGPAAAHNSTANTSVQSWTVQKRPLGASVWTSVLFGTGGGSRNPTIDGVEGARANFRVVATDKQGNVGIGPMRRVFVPIEQASLGFAGSYPDSASDLVDNP
jgi:hypothetical protein